MSDPLCVGVCMIDWDSGVCLGCGRTAEEIDGIPVSANPPYVAPSGQASALAAALPEAVRREVQGGSD